jgi:hypothetical protein
MKTIDAKSLTNASLFIGRLRLIDNPPAYITGLMGIGLSTAFLPLPNTQTTLKAVAKMATPQSYRGRFTKAGLETRNKVAAMLSDVFDVEVTALRLAVLNQTAVSQKLRAFGTNHPLTAIQIHLRDETILCLEIEAYRAAAVMGWNLAYDYIRTWLFNNDGHRKAFNRRLLAIKNKGTGKSVYKRIVKYSDFYTAKPAPNEYKVLELMEEAGLLKGVSEQLTHYLRERNQYAHASNFQPTADQVNHYLDNLIDIITSEHFPLRTVKMGKQK